MDTNRFPDDGIMTEERMVAELTTLCSYYEDMEAEARLIPANEERALPVVIGILTDDDGNSRAFSHSFMPLGLDSAEFSMFLQSYTELPLPEKPLDRGVILEALNALNVILPAGTCFLVRSMPEDKDVIGVRWTSGHSAFDGIDQGSFCESMFMLDSSCELILMALDAVAEGKTVDEAIAQIQGA